MTYGDMYKAALDAVSKLNGAEGEVGDTVCVICSKSGKMYSGMSRTDTSGGNVAAEIEAMRKMQSDGEFVVDTMILVKTADKSAALPYKSSVDYILSLDSENAKGVVMMSDKMVKLSEDVFPAAPAPKPSGGRTSGSLLKDRVNSIMSIAEEEDDDDAELLEELTSTKKKKFFGLFG